MVSCSEPWKAALLLLLKPPISCPNNRLGILLIPGQVLAEQASIEKHLLLGFWRAGGGTELDARWTPTSGR